MKTWVENIKEEYNLSKKVLEDYREKLDLDNPKNKEEDKIVGEMISDMKYALDWLNRGRRPGNRRGADRRSVYQRTSLMEMDFFPDLNLNHSKRFLQDEEKVMIVDILLELSARERQCYLLHMAQGMSYAAIAEELNLSRRTIQQYVERAKDKIKNKVA